MQAQSGGRCWAGAQLRPLTDPHDLNLWALQHVVHQMRRVIGTASLAQGCGARPPLSPAQRCHSLLSFFLALMTALHHSLPRAIKCNQTRQSQRLIVTQSCVHHHQTPFYTALLQRRTAQSPASAFSGCLKFPLQATAPCPCPQPPSLSLCPTGVRAPEQGPGVQCVVVRCSAFTPCPPLPLPAPVCAAQCRHNCIPRHPTALRPCSQNTRHRRGMRT